MNLFVAHISFGCCNRFAIFTACVLYRGVVAGRTDGRTDELRFIEELSRT